MPFVFVICLCHLSLSFVFVICLCLYVFFFVIFSNCQKDLGFNNSLGYCEEGCFKEKRRLMFHSPVQLSVFSVAVRVTTLYASTLEL